MLFEFLLRPLQRVIDLLDVGAELVGDVPVGVTVKILLQHIALKLRKRSLHLESDLPLQFPPHNGCVRPVFAVVGQDLFEHPVLVGFGR